MRPTALRRAIENKADSRQLGSKTHINYAIYHQGQRVSRVTIPHGRKALTPGTLQSIRRQLRLGDMEQLENFVRCPMSKQDYEAILNRVV